jgi:integrase
MTNQILLETRIDQYLGYRRSLGYGLAFDEAMLRSFVRFVASRKLRGRLKPDWVEEFASAPRDVHPKYRRRRHQVISEFARYWAAYDSGVEVPGPCEPGPGYRRQEPHIYSDKEVESLITAARSGQTFTGETQATLIGLMACTGLRTGEARNLRKGDVDLVHALLRIRHSKNRPLRLVPVHETTVNALRIYERQRDARFPLPKSDHFFLNKVGRPVSKSVVDNFARLRRRAGIAAAAGRRRPRLYDLRHTFACKCLLSWLQEGKDVSRSIHRLATYLGHDGVKDTYWYLTSTPMLLDIVGSQFERHARDARRACP